MKQFLKAVGRLFHGQKREIERPSYMELVQVPAETLGQTKPLEDEDYYHGFLMDKEVETIFKNIDEGYFLLRRVQTFDGLEYVLSVKGDELCNVLINVTKERKLYWVDVHAFKTIQQLVSFYVNSQIPFRVYNPESADEFELVLKRPVKRFSWELNPEQIELDCYLGNGQFGEVWKGNLEVSFSFGRKLVAVKKLKEGNLTAQQKYELLKEADYMKKLNHPNVVKFYGISSSRDPFMMALELCTGGALDSTLQKKFLTDFQRIRFLYQAALGIDYLHKIGIVHGDIAARNCLLTGDNVLKIADFGLSADKGGTKHKTINSPVRYMAPEAIEKLISTKESDVYAFSVLIFEMFHRAFEPFGEFLPADKVLDALKRNEIHLYLFDRPRNEIIPQGMIVAKRAWYLKLDKPEQPQIQVELEILFKHARFRNVKFRAVFANEGETESRRSIVRMLTKMMKKYNTEN